MKTAALSDIAEAGVLDPLQRCMRYEGAGLRSTGDADALVLERASGSHLFDHEGRRYLDLSGLFAVANIGHGHPAVVEAVIRQAHDLMHCPSANPSRVRAEFYEAVASIAPSGLTRILPAITGAMANETAVQIAKTRRPNGTVVSFSGSYFGRSAGIVGLAGKAAYRQAIGIASGGQFLPFPFPSRMGGDGSADSVLATLDLLAAPGGGLGEVAAVVVEPIQGNGGVVVPPAAFLPGLRRFCDRTGALLIVDEIQSGCGRSGRMWAVEHTGVTPDLMTIGKGIGGGMAVAAILGSDDVMTWRPDSYSSTFLTNNVNLAAAVAAIGVLRRERLPERSARLGESALGRLRQQLNGTPGVVEIRGKGLWLAIELGGNGSTGPALAKSVIRRLRERGVVAGGGGYEGQVVKLQPPLTIDERDLDEGLDAVIGAVKSVAGGAAP